MIRANRALTTIRLNRDGRIVGTWTFGRTGENHGAYLPLVVSTSPGGRLLQLSSNAGTIDSSGALEGVNPRDELRTLWGPPVVRRVLSYPGQDMEEPRPWMRPGPLPQQNNGMWLDDSNWLLIEVRGLWRGQYLHLVEKLLPDELGFYSLAPGPQSSWAVLVDGDVDLRWPKIIACDVDCQQLWTITSEQIEDAIEHFFTVYISRLRMCLDTTGRPVICWEEVSVAGDRETVAGLETDGSVRWRAQCGLPWADVPDIIARRESGMAITAGPGGHVAVLLAREVVRDPEAVADDEPTNYYALELVVLDADGGMVWERHLIEWSPENTIELYDTKWLLWDEDRLYLQMVTDPDADPGLGRWGILCVDAETGDALWSRHLRELDDDSNNTSPMSARVLSVCAGGGLLLGYRAFFATAGTRAP